jgi:hypothetical protein
MNKTTASIVFRPNPNDPDQKILQEYLKNTKEGISVTSLEVLKRTLLALAVLEHGKPDPGLAMENIIELHKAIDRIYVEYHFAGINLPNIGTTTWGFNQSQSIFSNSASS